MSGIPRALFLREVVEPTVRALGMPTPEKAIACLLPIAAWESRGCRELFQIGGGPGRGPYQFEQPTVELVNRRVEHDWQHPAGSPQDEAMVTFMRDYRVDDSALHVLRADIATAYARMLLWYNPRPLPGADDLEGIYRYYLDTWRPGKPPQWGQFRAAFVVWA